MHVSKEIVVLCIALFISVCGVAYSATNSNEAKKEVGVHQTQDRPHPGMVARIVEKVEGEIESHKIGGTPHPGAITPIQLELTKLQSAIQSLENVVLANQSRDNDETVLLATALRNIHIMLDNRLPPLPETR